MSRGSMPSIFSIVPTYNTLDNNFGNQHSLLQGGDTRKLKRMTE